MKATGVVRRIDDLGRVVIPKEIRRHLRIKEGNSLEIFVDRQGEIILKKYSPIEDITEFVQQYADAIYSSNKKDMIICDREKITAATGNIKKQVLDNKISRKIEDYMDKRISKIENEKKTIKITEDFEVTSTYSIFPILVNGDCVGCLMIFSYDETIEEIDIVSLKVASQFLGKYLEG